jgi:hypothetical protein
MIVVFFLRLMTDLLESCIFCQIKIVFVQKCSDVLSLSLPAFFFPELKIDTGGFFGKFYIQDTFGQIKKRHCPVLCMTQLQAF